MSVNHSNPEKLIEEGINEKRFEAPEEIFSGILRQIEIEKQKSSTKIAASLTIACLLTLVSLNIWAISRFSKENVYYQSSYSLMLGE